MRTLLFLFFSLLCITATAQQQHELRTWTSQQGSTIDAKYLGIQRGVVTLQKADGSRTRIRLRSLSQEDQAYVRSLASSRAREAQPPATARPQTAPNPAEPRTRHTRMPFTSLGGSVEIGGVKFKGVRTEHFLVLTADGSPRQAAENAEEVWEETQLILADLGNRFPSGENFYVPLIFIQDRYEYEEFFEWYHNHLEATNPQAVAASRALFQQVGSLNIELPAEILQELGTSVSQAQVFNETNQRPRGKLDPFRTHVIAKRLLRAFLHGNSGPFWLSNGFGFRMEIRLCEETRTNLIDYNAYNNPDRYGGTGDAAGNIRLAQGFQDGRKWVDTLRKMMRKKDGIKGDVAEVLGAEMANLNPEKLGYIFALTDWMLRSPEAQRNYETMLESALAGGGLDLNAILQNFELADISALTEAWHAYMLGREFR